MTKRCLFGGTLLAAGMITGAAEARDFTFQYTFAYVATGDFTDFDPFDNDYFAGSGPYSVSASAGFAKADAYGNSECITGIASTEEVGQVGGAGSFFSYFQVDSAATVNVSWDFSGHQDANFDFINSEVTIIDLTMGVFLVAETNLSNVSGSTNINLVPGNQYFIRAIAIAGDEGTGTSWYNVCIPAPSSAGLLALAGLAAARRRR